MRAFFHKVIQWMKNKSHEDRDGDSPAERRKKRNITEDAAEKIFIIPKPNIKKMIKEKTCQKFKESGKEACKKKIQDVARNGVELENIFSHQSHIFGCAEEEINGDHRKSVDRAKRQNQKTTIIGILQNQSSTSHFPDPSQKGNEHT